MIVSRKYEVIDQIGRGGMGVVYKVRHTALDTLLALKVLPAYLMENQEMVARFYREARVMARLRHRNTVRVLDIDHDDELNFHYFVMEYIQGKTLRAYTQEKGPLPLTEVLNISRQVASALEYAHRHNPPVIHRDIKPANIMVEDVSGRVVVMDFGIAKELGESEMTRTGMLIGTVKYCSPEQMRNEPLDGSADIYSLGMVVYEAYTGMQFFAGLDEQAVIGKVLYDAQENEPVFSRPTPSAFTAIIRKAITKKRQQRYQTMTEFLRALDECESTLEETQTILLPRPASNARPAEDERGSVEDLEEQIHKLEEERWRRLVSSSQIQAQEAREQAERGRARERTPTLFQQGLALQEQAQQFFRANAYAQAQAVYQEAVILFTRASEEAQAKALAEKVAHAQHDMVAAKEEAEFYGAREKARTFYSRGLALQVQAEGLQEQQDNQQAESRYIEARKAFEDARELAYRETLKDEANTVRQELRNAKQAAIEAEAKEFAEAALQEALVSEQRADTAMEREEFTQAREWYHTAHQQYLRAQEQARHSKQRQRALTAQQGAQAARQLAEAQGISRFSPATYQQALKEQAQGEAFLAAQEYDRTILAYEQAQALYEQGEREANEIQHQQRQAAEVVRQQRLRAETASDNARKARAAAQSYSPWANEVWEAAQRLEEEAEQAWQVQDYEQAVQSAEAATQQYQRVRLEGDKEQQRQQTVAAEALLQAERERSEAERVQANIDFATDFTALQQTLDQGRSYEIQRQFIEATHCYDQAAQGFSQLRQHAEQRIARESAAHARQRMVEVRERVSPQQQWAASQWTHAQDWDAKAERAYQAQEYASAREGYEQARLLYEQTDETAEQERLRHHTLALQRQALASKQEAEAAQAEHYAPESFAQGMTAYNNAEQHWQVQEFHEAGQSYRTAHVFLTRAETEAQLEQARQAVAVASQRMHEARMHAEAAGAHSRLHEAFDQAQRLAEQGHEREQQQDFSQARDLYVQAEQRFIALLQTTELQIAREQAEILLGGVYKARESASALAQWVPALWKKAQELEASAERAWQAQDYARASSYAGAAQRQYEQAVHEGEQEQLRAQAQTERQRTAQARQEARAIAAEYAAALYHQGKTTQAQGEQAFAERHWENALVAFVQAREFFLQARTEAHRIQARQATEEIKAEAVLARREAEHYIQLFPEQLAEITSFFLSAEQALAQEDFSTARDGFGRCVALSRKLQTDAELKVQKEQAEQTGAHAHSLAKNVSIAGKGRRQKRAQNALLAGDKLLQQQRYVDAKVRYTEAATLFAELQPVLQQEDVPTTILPPPASQTQNTVHQPRIATFGSTARFAIIAGSFALVAASIYGIARQRIDDTQKFPLTEEQLTKTIEETVPPPLQPPSPSVAPAPALSPSPPPVSTNLEPAEPAPERKEPDAKIESSSPQEFAATPPPVALPPPQPPRLTRFSPALEEPPRTLQVAEGQTLAFSVEAESETPQTLRFTWFLDGAERGKGKRWVYKPGFEDSSPQAKEVKVIVSDGAHQSVEHSWRVIVQETDRPPQITASTPASKTLEVTAGSIVDFSVDATDPDKEDRLAYVWSLDGREVARGSRWQFNPPVSASPVTRYRVTAEVLDQKNQQDRVAWNVTVKTRIEPPRIIDAQPREETLTTQVGQAIDFALIAELVNAQGESKQRLSYVWNVEGEKRQTTTTGRYRLLKKEPGAYKVTALAVSPNGQESAPKQWLVKVRPVEIPPPPVALVPQLSDEEVQRWLETYRRAWEGRDVDTLVQLGEITSQDAGKLKSVFASYNDFQVRFQNVEIHREGTQAVVTFTRVDVLDGKSLPHPDRKVLTLEKDAKGRISRRP